MPDRKLRVFLCHASQDKPIVRELYQRLLAEGWIDPWLDEENLRPGQDWGMEIDKAVELTDAVIVCLSEKSVTKEGVVQREIKRALDKAEEKPEDVIFVIPLRLGKCTVPYRLKKYQYQDYFEGDQAYIRLRASLERRAGSIGIDILTIKKRFQIKMEEVRKKELQERIKKEEEEKIRQKEEEELRLKAQEIARKKIRAELRKQEETKARLTAERREKRKKLKLAQKRKEEKEYRAKSQRARQQEQERILMLERQQKEAQEHIIRQAEERSRCEREARERNELDSKPRGGNYVQLSEYEKNALIAARNPEISRDLARERRHQLNISLFKYLTLLVGGTLVGGIGYFAQWLSMDIVESGAAGNELLGFIMSALPSIVVLWLPFTFLSLSSKSDRFSPVYFLLVFSLSISGTLLTGYLDETLALMVFVALNGSFKIIMFRSHYKKMLIINVILWIIILLVFNGDISRDQIPWIILAIGTGLEAVLMAWDSNQARP